MRTLIFVVPLLLASFISSSGAAPPERDCATLRTFPPHTMGIHVSGGKQGRNDWYVVDLTSGSVCIRKRGEEARASLSTDELQRLRRAVESAGLLSWKGEYLPAGRVADGVTTEIVLNDGERRHRVVRAEPALPPAGFLELARRFELLSYVPFWHSTTWLYVAGRLEHSELEGGFWSVVYARGDEATKDKYGGRMVLHVDPAAMRGFKPGDLVLLTGAVDTERAGIQMAGTYYTVKRIEHLR